MTLLDIDRRADDRTGLHNRDFRIRHRQAAAAMSHHRVEFVQRIDNVLDYRNRLVLRLGQELDLILGVRHELMERRIEEADRDRIALERFVKLLEVVLLVRKNLRERDAALLERVGADHLAESGDAARLEEHVLGTAKPDSLGSEFARLLRVARSVGVGAHLKPAELVGPVHDAAELAGDGRVDRGDHAVVDVAGGAVDGKPVAFAVRLAVEGELLVLLVHGDFLAAGNAAGSHAAGDNGRVGGHSAADGENALRGLHALDILGGSLETHEHDLLAALLPLLGVVGGEDDFAARGSRRGGQPAAHDLALLERGGVELRMEERVEVAGLDHQHGLFLGAHALVDEIARDLKRGLGGALAVAGLEHEELLVLDGELHVLHIAVVALERPADLLELLEALGHDLGHLGDRHRGAHAGDDVFALGVHQKFAHELLLARGGIASEGDARARLLVEVPERHHLHVHRSAPAVGDVVVAAVDVGARIVPAAEHRLDRLHELLLGVGGEVPADLRLVFGLELAGEFPEIFGGKIDVERDALLLLHLVDEFFKILLADLHDDVGEHLDETAVAVPRPAGILRLLGERLDHFLVEAEVENRVHHAGHRRARAGTDGNEKRIVAVAELLAGRLLKLVDVLHDLRHDILADDLAVVIVTGAGFGGNREALRHGKPEPGHFREVGAFTAEKLAHSGISFGQTGTEEVNILFLFTHFLILSFFFSLLLSAYFTIFRRSCVNFPTNRPIFGATHLHFSPYVLRLETT